MRAVLAVDGGNSKTDVAIVAEDGRLIGAVRGPTISHQQVGIDEGRRRLAELVGRAGGEGRGGAAAGPAEVGVLCLAGADYRSDVALLERGFGELGLVGRIVVLNDTFAALRAGSSRPWGVVLICGQGVNAAGVAPDGRTARFDAVGDLSGDWGGGTSIGRAGLAAAVRGRDGRGPRTALERTVPAVYGLSRPAAVTRRFYDGRLDERRIGDLAPVVFATAGDGDPVARAIVDHLADELVAMATALIRRLRLRSLDVEVVLGGGVFRTDDRPFHERLAAGIRAVAPRATLVRPVAPPVAGSALLALDRLDPAGRPPTAEVAARVRAGLAAALEADPAASRTGFARPS